MAQRPLNRFLPATVLFGIFIVLAVLAVGSLSISEKAAAYPQALIAASFVLVLVQLASVLPRRTESQTEAPDAASPPSVRAGTYLALFCLCWLLYPLLLVPFGFILATTLALFASISIFRIRRRWTALLGLFVFVVIFAVLLKTVIYIPVPEAWPDKIIDSIIYSF